MHYQQKATTREGLHSKVVTKKFESILRNEQVHRYLLIQKKLIEQGKRKNFNGISRSPDKDGYEFDIARYLVDNFFWDEFETLNPELQKYLVNNVAYEIMNLLTDNKDTDLYSYDKKRYYQKMLDQLIEKACALAEA